MKKIIKKSVTNMPASSKIFDTLNIDNKITNTYSARIISDLLSYSSGGSGLPIGAGCDFFGTTPPSGFLFADGSAVSRTTYADLFAVIGTTYGAGDGSTTFNLPDKRERVSVMYKSGSTNGTSGATLGTLGAKGGEFNHTLTTTEIPSHTHALTRQQWYSSDKVVNSDTGSIFSWKSGTGGTTSAAYQGASSGNGVQNTGGGTAHNNLQPYLVCNYIIKAKNVSTDNNTIINLLEGEY
jgi:microcystin-dependent protein